MITLLIKNGDNTVLAAGESFKGVDTAIASLVVTDLYEIVSNESETKIVLKADGETELVIGDVLPVEVIDKSASLPKTSDQLLKSLQDQIDAQAAVINILLGV